MRRELAPALHGKRGTDGEKAEPYGYRDSWTFKRSGGLKANRPTFLENWTFARSGELCSPLCILKNYSIFNA